MRGRSRTPGSREVALLLGLATALVVLIAVLETAEVATQAQLARLEFGRAYPFLVQSQASADPPVFPHETRLYTPLEYPTELRWPALVADVLAASAAVGLGWFGTHAVARLWRRHG